MSTELGQGLARIFGITEELIATRAYTKFEQRGYAHGFDVQDWLEAERDLIQEAMTGTTLDVTGDSVPGITEFIVGSGSPELGT